MIDRRAAVGAAAAVDRADAGVAGAARRSSMPPVPGCLATVPMAELQRRLVEGTVAELLDQEADAGEARQPARIGLHQEKHRRDSSSFVLLVTSAGGTDEAGSVRDLVLHYPGDGDPGAPPWSWWYPADPALPALASLDAEHNALQVLDWDTRWTEPLRGSPALAVERLSYYPGDRAVFRLTGTDCAERLILKVVHPAMFAGALERARLVAGSSLPRRVPVPALVSHSTRDCVLVFQHIAGTGLDSVRRRDGIGAALRGAVIDVLAAIHGTDPPALPPWDPAGELARSRRLGAEIVRLFPRAAPVLERTFARLRDTLGRADMASARLIHHDFSARNMILLDRHTARRAPTAIAVIDWDSAALGAVEKDVASMLSGLATDREEFSLWIDAYQRTTGRILDLELVNAFVQHQRMLKTCRRLRKLGRSDDASLAALEDVALALDRRAAPSLT